MPSYQIYEGVSLSTIKIRVMWDADDRKLVVKVTYMDPRDGDFSWEITKTSQHFSFFFHPLIQKLGLLDSPPISHPVKDFYSQLFAAMLVLLLQEGEFRSWYDSVGLFPWDQNWRVRTLQEIPCSKAQVEDVYNVIHENLKVGFPEDVEAMIAELLKRLDCSSQPTTWERIAELGYSPFSEIARFKIAERKGRDHS